MSRSRQGQPAQLSKEQRFSESRAIQLCDNVKWMESHSGLDDAKLGETLRLLAEALVYNDKHNEAVVDKVLMERDLMTTLERLVTNAMLPTSVKVYVLQCVTVLLQNLTRVSSVYFLCSNNRINRMIAIPLDEEDDEFLSMYVSFLKSLALRLNKDTVQFFFESDTGAFPLFDKAVKMLRTTKDPMVRAATRQIVVCIAQISDDAMQAFLKKALVEVYEAVLVSITRQLAETAKLIPWLKSGTSVDFGTSSLSPRAIFVLMEDLMDDVLYLNDLYHNTPSATTDTAALREVVVSNFLSPLVALLTNESGAAARQATASNGQAPVASHPSAMSMAPPSAALGFTARWASANEIGVVQDAFTEAFFNTAVEGERDCLLLVLLRECPHLSTALLLLRDSLLLHSETSATQESVDSVLDQRSCASPPPSCAASDELLASPDTFVREVLFDGALLSGASTDGDARMVSCLVHMLHGCLTAGVTQTAMSSLVVLLRQIKKKLSHAGFERFAYLTEELCKANLRAKYWQLYAPAVSYAVGDNSEGLQLSNASATMDRWLDSHHYVEGLGISDAFLVLYLEARSAWDYLQRGDKLATLLAGFDEKDIAPLLPLMPCLEDTALAVQWDSRTKEAYLQLQRQVADLVPAYERAAADSLERERADFLVWFVVSDCCQEVTTANSTSAGGRVAAVFASHQSPHRALATVSLCRGEDLRQRSLFLHCQVVSLRYEEGGQAPAKERVGEVHPGADMYLTLTATEALFLCAEDTADTATPRTEWTVLVAFDIAYVRAALLPPPANYRVIVQGLRPRREVEMHLVFKDEGSARSAVAALNHRARSVRQQAASLSREIFAEEEQRNQ